MAAGSRRPRPAQLPPWLGALAMVGAVLLTINLVPSIAAAITADTADKADKAASSLQDLTPAGAAAPTDLATDSTNGSANGSADGSASGSASGSANASTNGSPTATRPAAPQNCPPAHRAPAPTPAPSPGDTAVEDPDPATKPADTARSFGVDPSTLADRHAAVRSALTDARVACTKPLPRSGGNVDGALLAAVLLAAGLALLATIGFTTDRPWPGRYVRRTF